MEAALERRVGCVLRIENLPRTASTRLFANCFRENNKAASLGNVLETFRKPPVRMYRGTNLLISQENSFIDLLDQLVMIVICHRDGNIDGYLPQMKSDTTEIQRLSNARCNALHRLVLKKSLGKTNFLRFQQESLLFANRKQNEVESGKPRTKRECFANRLPETVLTWFASKPPNKRNLRTTCEQLFLNQASLVNQGPGFCEQTIWIGFQRVDCLRTKSFQQFPEPTSLYVFCFI
jgi:hypothetical protein